MNVRTHVSVLVALCCVLGLMGSVAQAAGPAAVNLGSAGNFVILSKTGISTTGSTAITGNIGVSPAAASYITGFALTLPAASAFSTSALVTGNVYAPGYANPTPSTLTTAVLDMESAYTDAAGRAPNVTELGAGTIGGLTLAPGVYKWSTGVSIPTDLTLTGNAADVWIFQVGQNLTVSSGARIILSGGAHASNIFWVVAGQTTLGTTAVMNGTILDQTAIVFQTGATLTGRALAQTAVTLEANSVTNPGIVQTTTPPPAPTPIPTTTPTPTTTSGSGQTTSQSQISTLTAAQRTQYDVLLSVGASQSAALSAVLQITMVPFTPLPIPTSEILTVGIDLKEGSRGMSVVTLQQFLISHEWGPAAGNLAEAGATGYFGALTRAALAEFQAYVGISPALGNFGPITRAYLTTHY